MSEEEEKKKEKWDRYVEKSGKNVKLRFKENTFVYQGQSGNIVLKLLKKFSQFSLIQIHVCFVIA